MSKTTQLLELAVADVIANRPSPGEAPTARQRALVDRAFARVLKIVAPRIRHFIKQYGLTGHWEDAEQVCAIGIHRAIEAYDPTKAMFTTFVNWQIRGELQGLRFRLMDDQRPSARKVDATTVSLQSFERGPDGEELSLEAMLVDENARADTESGAADHLAERASAALMDEYVRHLRAIGMAQLRRKASNGRTVTARNGSDRLPKFVQARQPQVDAEELAKLEERIDRDRRIVATYLFSNGHEASDAELQEIERGLTRERIRQITRRAARVMSELAAGNPRFQGFAETRIHPPADAAESKADRPGILPEAGQPHNLMVRVSQPAAGDGPVFIEDDAELSAPVLRLRH